LPVAVHLPSGVTATAISAGDFHSLAVTSTGRVYAWGDNGSGELGDGTYTGPQTCPSYGGLACSPTPVAVNLPAGVTASAVAAGGLYSLALTRLGHVWAWGDNTYGELGDGNLIGRTTPAPVRLFAPGSGMTATAIAAGYQHSLALTSTGQVYAWGANGVGELGDGTSTGPQLCTGNYACSLTPVAVGLPSGVTATALAAGGYNSLAVDP
jgi:alpha-tubulin suppressor-like RCC1 family protein